MRVIYEPSGKALEYSPLACNLRLGCSHGCTYCYGPSIQKKTRQQWLSYRERKDILKKLSLDCRDLSAANDQREILFCFMTDPYMVGQDNTLTRAALDICADYGVMAQVLTKGGLAAAVDFDLLSSAGYKFGSTLGFFDESLVRQYEPGASSISSRIQAIKTAHGMGIYTWVSCEPVIRTDEVMTLIRSLSPYVDLWKLGRWNYSAEANAIDWAAFRTEAVSLLDALGARYYIKKDLADARPLTMANSEFIL